MDDCSIVYSFAFLIVVWLLTRLYLQRRRQYLPLPPGPKPAYIIGNITDLPPKEALEWQHWLKHKDKYGPISSVTVFGQTIILVHDYYIAVELFERRGSRYSSRPKMVFAGDLCGYGNRMPFQPYNDSLRTQRKLAAHQLGTKNAVAAFQPLLETEVRKFLLRMLEQPGSLSDNLEKSSASLMLNMLYDYSPRFRGPDILVNLITRVMTQFSQATTVGAWLVDVLPWLRLLPEWVPGAGFQKLAREWKRDSEDSMIIPADFVERQMAQNNGRPCYVERLLRNGENKDDVRVSAGALYTAGVDTTAAGPAFFFLATTLYPDVQREAQEEIERVVGRDRLPSFQDRDKLPYINAIVKETLRWQPPAPLCPPHMNGEEDEFRGMRIPKNSIIIPNIKWFASDPSVYRDPEIFRPERFLGDSPAPDPYDYVFGFGRRICPGKLLADSSLFLIVAQSLAVFDVRKKIDAETGMSIEPTVGTTNGLVARPLPFQCDIVSRTKGHLDLIKDVGIDDPGIEGDGKIVKELAWA